MTEKIIVAPEIKACDILYTQCKADTGILSVNQHNHSSTNILITVETVLSQR